MNKRKQKAAIACICDDIGCDTCPKYKLVMPDKCYEHSWPKNVVMFFYTLKRLNKEE